MSATLGAAALSAGAGLIGSFFGANKQDKAETKVSNPNANKLSTEEHKAKPEKQIHCPF